MDLNLSRIDYLQVGLTNQKSMRLLPSAGGKEQQRVAIGDFEGVVQVFGMKKREVNHTFKTLPGKEITRLELGGALGTVKDKIFTSSGNEVRGYTKKGKLFLGFDTNLTEEIRSMAITGNDLVVAGKHVYNHYRDCRDTNYFLSEDPINDILTLPGEKVTTLTPVLACQDRSLKVLRDSTVMYNLELPGPPTALHLFYNDGGEHGDEVLYGTSDGKVGQVRLSRQHGPHTQWLLEREGVYGEVGCLDNFDVSGDGVKDLIVGRHDGSVEVYAYDEGEEAEPVLKFSHNCGESVTSIEGGVVGTAGFEEIVATTYSGWCFGLTSEATATNHAKISSDMVTISDGTREKLAKLRNEIEELQQRVNVERERYQEVSSSAAAAVVATPTSSSSVNLRQQQHQPPTSVMVSAIPRLNINDRFTLSQADASYNLSIEVQTSIDNVLLQSDVPLDLLDVEKNSAVVSFSACDQQESGNALLATYRCQANTTRLEIKIRTIEGQYGILQAYITPRLQPKCCQVQQYFVKPLSLHMRAHQYDATRPCNTLRLRGQFSLPEMHSWVGFCLPEVPEKPPSGDEANFNFISTFLDTMLNVAYMKGEATFKSDNISTISILKDFMTKEATKKRINLSIDCDVNDESVIHTLELLHPKLEAQLLLAKQVALIEPLKDLAAHEEDTAFLSPEYQYILDNEQELQQQFKRQPAQLERLYGMITDLFIDQHKFKGQNVKGRVPQLLDILDKYHIDSLIGFFQNN